MPDSFSDYRSSATARRPLPLLIGFCSSAAVHRLLLIVQPTTNFIFTASLLINYGKVTSVFLSVFFFTCCIVFSACILFICIINYDKVTSVFSFFTGCIVFSTCILFMCVLFNCILFISIIFFTFIFIVCILFIGILSFFACFLFNYITMFTNNILGDGLRAGGMAPSAVSAPGGGLKRGESGVSHSVGSGTICRGACAVAHRAVLGHHHG